MPVAWVNGHSRGYESFPKVNNVLESKRVIATLTILVLLQACGDPLDATRDSPQSDDWNRVLPVQAQVATTLFTTGVPGNDARSLLTTDGTVLCSNGARIRFWLYDLSSGGIYVPGNMETAISLCEGYLPIPKVRWILSPGLEMETEVCALLSGDEPPQTTEDTFFQVRNQVFNNTGKIRQIRIFAEIDPGGGDLAIRENQVLRRGLPLIQLPGNPDFFGTCSEKGDRWESLEPGMTVTSGPAIVCFDFEVNSADGAFAQAVPMVRFDLLIAGRAGSSFPDTREVRTRYSKTRTYWSGQTGLNKLSIDLPDRIFFDAFRTAVACLLLEFRGQDETGMTVGDAAMAAMALARSGHFDRAVQLLDQQVNDGSETSLCEKGLLIFALADLFRFTGDTAWREKVFPFVQKVAEELNLMIQESQEMQRPFHEECWIVQGLRGAAVLADEEEIAADYRRMADGLARSIQDAVEKTVEEKELLYIPEGVKGTAMPEDGSAMISLLWPEPVLDAQNRLVRRSFERWSDDLFKAERDGYRKKNSPLLNGVEMALPLILLNDKDRVQAWLEYYLDRQSNQGAFAWKRALPVDALARSSVSSSAAYVIALRTLFLRERGEVLVLSPCLPLAWLRAQETLEIENAPTYYGPVSYRTRTYNRTTELELFRASQPPGGFVLPPVLISYEPHVEIDGRSVQYDLDYERRQEIRIPAQSLSVKIDW